MTTFTVFATATTDRPLAEIEAAVRGALASLGVDLIPCGWAPDPDTISDNITSHDTVELVDLNEHVDRALL